MTFEEFEQAVDSAVSQIPPQFQAILEEGGIDIIARDSVPQRVREQFPNSLVFGVFVGLSKKQNSSFAFSTEPTRIEIYQESFEKSFGSLLNERIKNQILRTVIHEIGHYMGFNEKELRERGY